MEFNRRFSIGLISLIFCAFICWSNGTEFEEFRTVDTTLGKIRGKRDITWINNEVFYSFKGIPYAKTPIGNLRLKAPEPVEPWAPNVLDAIEPGFTCIRPAIVPYIEPTPQDEDCLSMNIFVPARANPENKVPVFFIIHGGGYNLLSGSDYLHGPDHLVEEDIIIVSINYRLGVLGFLSLNTPEYSGNMGLKDQQMALKWVYDNIGGFGGDNKKITLSGYSAGASSSHLHLLSKESRQYINNVYLMSGSAANIWALSDENDHTAFAFKMAEEAGSPKTSFTGLINFLLNASITQLQTAGIFASTFYNTFYFKMAPVIERPDAIRPFLLKEPLEMYKDEVIDKDIMVSTSQMELSAFYNAYPILYPKKLQKMHKNFTFTLPFRNMPFGPDSEEYEGILENVRDFYFGDKRVGIKTHVEYMTMISDLNFDYANFITIKRHIQESKGKVYALRFSVNATLNYIKRNFADRSSYATHMDDLCYVMSCKGTQYHTDLIANPSSEESRISIQTIAYMVKIVSNFIKYGNPTYKDEPIAGFGPVQCFDITVLNITNHGLEIDTNPRKLEVEFWDDLSRKIEKMAPKNRYRY